MRTTWFVILLMFSLILSACGGSEPVAPTDTPTDVPPTTEPTTEAVAAQSDAVCPDYVQTALSETSTLCEPTGRNQACYGNSAITLNPIDNSADITFEQPGDIVDVSQIQSLQLQPLDTATNTWGIALMYLQANLSDTTPGQNVTFLMFGDVQLENRSPDETTNIQSFYFTSGIGDAACASAPESGLLIQTPEGVGKVDLLINEIDISIGSTAYLQAQPDADMIVNVVEGEAEVTAQGVTETVTAGNRTTIGLDENGIADSPPTAAEPYQSQPLRLLPVRNLPRPITIVEQVTALEFTPIGFEITDSIDDPSEVDVFAFDATAGQQIYIDSVDGSLGLHWSFYFDRPENADAPAESQTRLSLIHTSDRDLGLFELAETGSYQIVVRSRDESSTGAYQFKVWDVPPPDTLALASVADMPAVFIGMGTGEIETPGASDEYAITIDEGQTLYFDGIDSPYAIKWNVYGADDEAFLRLNYDVGSDLEAITFEATGTYTLRVWGDDDGVGTYSFQIWDVPPVDERDLSLPADPPDQLIGMGSGEIETPGVEDIYTIDVEAGQTLYFDGIDSPYAIKWNVYPADGEPLIRLNYDVGSDLEAITFEAAGTYTLRIWGDADGVGQYSFQIWDVPPIDTLELTQPRDLIDRLVGIGLGEIETPGVEDVYTIDVEAGQTLYFDGIDSPYAIKWNVYPADGEPLIRLNYDVGSDLEAITFEEAGTYTLHVWGDGDGVGTYSFQIWDVPPVDELDLSLPDGAIAGLIGVGQGEIETPGVQDIYTIDVEAGQTLYFDGIDSPYAIKWNVYPADGEPLIRLNYDVGSDLEAIIFEESGTYTIRVWGDGDGVGAYQFEVRENE